MSFSPEFGLKDQLGWMAGHESTFDLPVDLDVVPEHTSDALVSYYVEYLFEMNRQTTPRQLSFLAIDAPPYVFANRLSNQTLRMRGPLYSLFWEMARTLNYSTFGFNTESNNLAFQFARYRPDLIITLMWPQLSSVREVAIDNALSGVVPVHLLEQFEIPRVVSLSDPIGMLELDHFVSPVWQKPKEWYSLLLTFGNSVWLAIVFALLSISFASFCGSRFLKLKTSFQSHLWIYFQSLLTSPLNSFKRFGRLTCLMMIVWLFAVFILQQHLSDEMFAEMVRKTPSLKMDSWDDLMGTKLAIRALNPDVLERRELSNSFRENYFPPGSIYHDDFTPRLKLFPLSISRGKSLLSLLLEFKNKVLMLPKLLLEYGLNNYRSKAYRRQLHVSESGGGVQPYFLMASHFAERVERERMNFVYVS